MWTPPKNMIIGFEISPSQPHEYPYFRGYNDLMSYPLTCVVCKRAFVSRFSHTKFCSPDCKKRNYAEKTGRFVQKDELPSGTVGAITELAVAAFLMQHGYAVFRALSPMCFCDLIAIKDATVLNVEARTGYFNQWSKKLTFPRELRGNANCYGIYERNSGKIYILDLERKPLEI